jgi:hypothetical protein
MPAFADYFEGHSDIIHMVLDGEWTIQDWLLCSYQAATLIQQSPSPVRLVLEYRSHPMYYPPSLFANLSYIGNSPLIREHRIQRVIVVGENGILHTASEVFRRVYRLKRVVVANDLHQARSLLELAVVF